MYLRELPLCRDEIVNDDIDKIIKKGYRLHECDTFIGDGEYVAIGSDVVWVVWDRGYDWGGEIIETVDESNEIGGDVKGVSLIEVRWKFMYDVDLVVVREGGVWVIGGISCWGYAGFNVSMRMLGTPNSCMCYELIN